MKREKPLQKTATCFAVIVCLIAFYSASTERSFAAPVVFGSNAYEFISVLDPTTGTDITWGTPNTWDTARAAAAALVFNGVSGHLATITSQAENDFLFGLASGNFTGFAGAWLGGKAPEGWLVGPETGQSFSYTNWAGIEPNNAGYAYMSIGTVFAPGQWADDSGIQGLPELPSDPVVGYFVEYENVALPAPPTLAILVVGLACVGFLRRRRRSRSAVRPT